MKLIRTEDAVGSVLCHDMTRGQAKEGKIEIKADADGLFLADRRRLALVNGQDQLMIATRMGNAAVKKGDKLAGMRSGNGVSQSFDLSFYDGLQPERGCGDQFCSCHNSVLIGWVLFLYYPLYGAILQKKFSGVN